MSKVDLTALSDEELEQEGFRRGEARAEADLVHREAMLEVQREMTRRSDARRLGPDSDEE